MTLMKKAWEQRGKITQLRRTGAECNEPAPGTKSAYLKLQELDDKLDKIAIVISEAQYYQYLAQQKLVQGNDAICTVQNEVIALEKVREEKIKQAREQKLPRAKL